MPQNLPQQILQRIVRLSADGNSKWEEARMLRVSQGCIRKILRCNRETGRPHQRTRGGLMKISTPREDYQLLRMVRTNNFNSAPRLRMQMIRRFGRRMSVRTIRRRLLAAEYWSRRPARCPRLTLEHRRRRRVWGRRHRVWDLRQWRHCIFSDESASSHGGRSELVVVDGAMNRHRYIQILRNQMLSWATGVFECNVVYVQDNAPPHTSRDTAAFLDQQDVEVRSWTGQLWVQTWTQLSMFGIKCQSGSETWMTPTHLPP